MYVINYCYSMVPQKDPEHYEQIQNVLVLLHCPIFVTSTKHYIKSMDVRFRFHHQMVLEFQPVPNIAVSTLTIV